MKRAILVLCIIGSVVAGRNLQPKIVNGYDAKISSFPSMVSIRLKIPGKFNGHLCGGTLLNEEWVLTAAHCIEENISVDNYSVQYGNADISPAGSNVVKVAKIIPHEGYNDSIDLHDIAVFKLAKPISDPPEGFRVKLPFYGSHILTGSPAVATGWGVNSTGAKDPQKTLQTADLVAFPAFRCKQMFQVIWALANSSHFRQLDKKSEIFETYVCASVSEDVEELKSILADPSKLKGVCKGDSGGPLFVDGVQVGITSFGYPPCGLLPSAFTAVSFYVKWIAEKTGINLEPNIFLRSEAKSEDASRARNSKKSDTRKDKKGKSKP